MTNSIANTTRPIKLGLNTHPARYGFPQFQLAQAWKQSIIHDMFSFSLPHAEKSAFEETFKFIIVTSHLINPSLSIHHKTCENETRIIRPKQEQVLPWTCGLSCLFVAEKYYSSLNVPVVTLIISGTVGIFYSLRQKHRRSIRQLYQTALSSVQSLIDHSEKLDNLLYQTLVLIKEDELVHQGYRLEMPHSCVRPSTTFSQNTDTKLWDKATGFLRRLFMLYEEAVIILNQVTDPNQLNTLYDMYNIRLIASLSSQSPKLDTENIDHFAEIFNSLTQLAQLMHAKRRECMVTLLSLSMMMDFSVIGSNQIQDWKIVNEVLDTLVKGTMQLHDEWEYALHTEQGCLNSDSWKTHLNTLEQDIRDLAFNIKNCKENLSLENDSNWVTEYWLIKEKLQNMMETFNSAEQLLTNDDQDSDSSPEVLSPKDIERMFVWPPNKENDRRRKRE